MSPETSWTCRFAGQAEARKILAEPDVFIRAMSAYERSARMRTSAPVSTEAFLAHAAGAAREWEPQEMAKVSAALDALRPRLTPYTRFLPNPVWLIKTDGSEENGSAYTRGSAIILPPRKLDYTTDALVGLLAHELFHILSQFNPRLRDLLYAAAGFERCGPVILPEPLQSHRVTNPDAPWNEHFICIRCSEQEHTVLPVLYSLAEDPSQEGFFKAMIFRFLALECVEGSYQAQYSGGQPLIFDPAAVEGFFEQVGRNTDYLIHPEEILACNFTLLVLPQPAVASPEVIERIAAIFDSANRQGVYIDPRF